MCAYPELEYCIALLNRLRDLPVNRRGALVCKTLDVLERTRILFLRSLHGGKDDPYVAGMPDVMVTRS